MTIESRWQSEVVTGDLQTKTVLHEGATVVYNEAADGDLLPVIVGIYPEHPIGGVAERYFPNQLTREKDISYFVRKTRNMYADVGFVDERDNFKKNVAARSAVLTLQLGEAGDIPSSDLSKSEFIIGRCIDSFTGYINLLSVGKRRVNGELRKDIIAEGTIGFLSAMQDFNLNARNNLTTFASWRVKRAAIDFVRSSRPDQLSRREAALLKHYEELPGNMGIEEKATLLHESPSVLERNLAMIAFKRSTTVYDDVYSQTHNDSSVASNHFNPEELVVGEYTAQDRISIANKVIEELGDRDKLVISMRYGIGDYSRGHTLMEIAEHLGLTESRLSQICTALDKKMLARAKALERTD